MFKALGLPTPELIFNILYHGSKSGAQYANFLVCMIGIDDEQIEDSRLRSPTTTRFTETNSGKVYTLNLWRKRVLDRDSKIMIREIYNPLTDPNAPLSLALGGIGWVTTIRSINVNTTSPDIEKEAADAQRIARGLLVLREAAEQTRGGHKIEELKQWMTESVDRYVQAQTASGKRPETWKFKHFAEHWQWLITSNNLYKLLTEDDRNEAEVLYKKRCGEIIRDRDRRKSV